MKGIADFLNFVSIFAILFLDDFLFKFCNPSRWIILARDGVSRNWNYVAGKTKTGYTLKQHCTLPIAFVILLYVWRL
jgi:hypothetical protein